MNLRLRKHQIKFKLYEHRNCSEIKYSDVDGELRK